MPPGTARELRAIIDAALRGQLDEVLARKLHALGPEAVALAMLATSRQIAELESKGGDAKDGWPIPERDLESSEISAEYARARRAMVSCSVDHIMTILSTPLDRERHERTRR